jgi:hypothetical protein
LPTEAELVAEEKLEEEDVEVERAVEAAATAKHAKADAASTASPAPAPAEVRAAKSASTDLHVPAEEWRKFLTGSKFGKLIKVLTSKGLSRKDLVISKAKIASLIGFSGNTKRKIVEQTGCEIFVLDLEGVPPGWNTSRVEVRGLVLVGTAAQVEEACTKILPYGPIGSVIMSEKAKAGTPAHTHGAAKEVRADTAAAAQAESRDSDSAPQPRSVEVRAEVTPKERAAAELVARVAAPDAL